ncbi:GTP cyclohydrolase II [Rhodococcus sp. JS3073]|uniref:GTP cyclohydrolase II n=1 Tax=Rhodococcus sp. JS3073 TaxID=3002901 RepID=UPI0022861BB5|nr:GTP cyclohydrolase II [Rhodococcus sp. JS3073]WAM19424.1 GTP cyclohydrolase II [Rhodococcus sp. JS3073]
MKSRVAIGVAVQAIAEGRMVLVADDEDRENEGDLVMAAEHLDTDDMTFLLRHGSGIVCTPMSNEIADRLKLDFMVEVNTDNHGTAFTVTVDANGAGTGISAKDRTRTVHSLASPDTRPEDLRRPGHVFPLRARPGGVLERDGHTEASVDLVRMAGCREVAVITELVADNGVPMSGQTLAAFAVEHNIPMITIADLIAHRRNTETTVRFGGSANLPTDYGHFEVRSYLSTADGVEHLVLTHGDIKEVALGSSGLLTRIHSECLTGDLIRSRRCDCGHQLDAALQAIVAEEVGVLIYMRGHEGRGIGLGRKLSAYALQEAGCDTVEANLRLGLPVDSRDFSVAAAILQDLGVDKIRLITNNPNKVEAVRSGGIQVAERVELPPAVTPDNLSYLRTKRDRMGHLLDLPRALPS